MNQFLGTHEWTEFDPKTLSEEGKSDKEIREKLEEKKAIQDSCSTAIKCFIKRHLVNKQDLIILHEVPDVIAMEMKGDGINKWLNVDEKAIIKYECLLPYSTAISPNFHTLAIFMKGKYEYNETYTNYVPTKFAYKGSGFRNRIIALNPKNKKSPIICGVHVCSDKNESPVYFESLIGLHNKFTENKATKIYYIGDFNAFIPNIINKRKMHDFMALGLEDYWLASGKSNNSPTHLEGARLDYVLTYNKSQFKNLGAYRNYFNTYEMIVDPENIVEMSKKSEPLLSDHSAIIIGTPTELKPFRKGDKK